MTLANMREDGVHSLSVTCGLCHHEAVMNVDVFDDAISVPAFGPAYGRSLGPEYALQQPLFLNGMGNSALPATESSTGRS
jgi:hypothetical protein